MFKKFMGSNTLCKIICFILFIISIIFAINTYVVILLISLVFIYSLLSNNNNLIFVSLLLPIVYLFSDINIYFTYIFKTVLIFIYLIVLINILDKKEKKYILEKLFYSGKDNTKWLLKNIYYRDKKEENKKAGYSSKKDLKKKTLYDMNDIYIFSKIRYYKFYKKRSNYFTRKWSSVDNAMIFISLIIMALSFWLRCV